MEKPENGVRPSAATCHRREGDAPRFLGLKRFSPQLQQPDAQLALPVSADVCCG